MPSSMETFETNGVPKACSFLLQFVVAGVSCRLDSSSSKLSLCKVGFAVAALASSDRTASGTPDSTQPRFAVAGIAGPIWGGISGHTGCTSAHSLSALNHPASMGFCFAANDTVATLFPRS